MSRIPTAVLDVMKVPPTGDPPAADAIEAGDATVSRAAFAAAMLDRGWV